MSSIFNGQSRSPDLRYDWPVKIATVDLPVRWKENLKRISGYSPSPLGTQNKNNGTTSKRLPTTDKSMSETQANKKDYSSKTSPEWWIDL